MKVGLFFDVRPLVRNDAHPSDIYGEFETLETIQSIASGLESLGHTVYLVDSQRDPLNSLQKLKGTLDLVFNTSVGFGTRFREMMSAAICEAVGVRYTGSDPMAQALTANKHVAKLVASSAGIPTPRWLLIGDAATARRASDVGRHVIIKPVFEGSSIGVRGPYATSEPVILTDAVVATINEYQQPVIVEEFIDGFEVTCPVLGVPPRALPLLALALDGSVDLGTRIFDSRIKADVTADATWTADLPIGSQCGRDMQNWTVAIHDAFGCRDLSRTDYRVTKAGQAYLIDVNATPQVAPTSSIVVSAALTGLTYSGFLGHVLKTAMER